MTHGREGDYTWRYRLWEWFQNKGIKGVQFVGPYSGTQKQLPPLQGNPPLPWVPSDGPDPTPPINLNVDGEYAEGLPAWDSNHFAVWGRQIAQDIDQIYAHVDKYKPDYLLVMLGFNDLGWHITDVEGTATNMKRFIDKARGKRSSLSL
jgi:hypothetical protein